MNQINEKCGLNIRRYREMQGMLQRELAERAGVPVKTVGRIERGEVDVRLGTLKKIADALGLSVGDLI